MVRQLALFFCITALISCTTERNYGDSVNASSILQVRLGMSKAEVVEILGEPVVQEQMTYTYTKERSFNYPMLWVHFDTAGVREVYAKYYKFIDDPGIYGLSYNNNGSRRWGEKALKKYFN